MVHHAAIVDNLTGLVIFEINNNEYCIDINDVSAIINPNELEEGINLNPVETKKIQVDELLVPIIDLYKYGGMGNVGLNLNKDTRILIIEIGDKKIGFFVDKIKEIITIDVEFKTNALKFLPEKDNSYLIGKLKYEGRQLNFPDLNRIIAESVN